MDGNLYYNLLILVQYHKYLRKNLYIFYNEIPVNALAS